MVRKSKECVINIPTEDLLRKVIGIGNSLGRATSTSSREFELTPPRPTKVKAPLIKECYANFECRLADASLINKYSLFVWEVVKAHVAESPALSPHHPLPRRWPVHGLRQGGQLPALFQAGNALILATPAFLDFPPAPRL